MRRTFTQEVLSIVLQQLLEELTIPFFFDAHHHSGVKDIPHDGGIYHQRPSKVDLEASMEAENHLGWVDQSLQGDCATELRCHVATTPRPVGRLPGQSSPSEGPAT